MKTVFDPGVRAGLQHRIQQLGPAHKAQWGKMDVSQMVRHCSLWHEWVLGKGRYTGHVYRQGFLGKLFGKWALSSNTRDEKPIGRNMPAGKFAIKDNVSIDLQAAKEQWIRYIDDYEYFANDRFVHDFFGKMSREQIGVFVYKHFDHHLRQFGV